MSLIDNIYEAMDDEDAYRLLPQTLAMAVGGRSATLMLYSPEYELEELMTHYFSLEMGEYYEENGIHRFDEWSRVMEEVTQGQGQTIRVGDYLSKYEYYNSFFYNEFIRNFGDDTIHCLGFGDKRLDGGRVTLGIHRGHSAQDFDDRALRRLESARPHLSRMAVIRRKLRRARAAEDLVASGLDTLSHAIVILDHLGQVAFANASAEGLLRDGSPLGLRIGRMRVADLRLDRLLRGMVKSALERRGARGGVLLVPAPGGNLRIHVSPHLVAQETHVLLLIEDAAIPADAAARLMAIYDLTPAEADVAVAASEGLSASEIGERFSITVATVRTHLQHIFQKMEVNKASQLARLVASLPGFFENCSDSP